MENKMTSKLVTFLRSIADQIEAKALTEEKIFEVSKFYMRYLFLEHIDDTTESEMMRFLSLGWYIYNNIIIYKFRL